MWAAFLARLIVSRKNVRPGEQGTFGRGYLQQPFTEYRKGIVTAAPRGRAQEPALRLGEREIEDDSQLLRRQFLLDQARLYDRKAHVGLYRLDQE